MKVRGDARADVGAEADRGFIREGRDLARGVENHFAQGPTDLRIVYFVDCLKGVGVVLPLVAVKKFFGAVVVIFQTNAGDSNSLVKNVDEPTRFEADFDRNFFSHLLAPVMILKSLLDILPVHSAEVGHTPLECIQVVCLLFIMALFKECMGRVPIFANTNKVVDVKVNGWDMDTVEQAGLIFTNRILFKKWVRFSQALIKLSGSNEIRSFSSYCLGSWQEDIALGGHAQLRRQAGV